MKLSENPFGKFLFKFLFHKNCYLVFSRVQRVFHLLVWSGSGTPVRCETLMGVLSLISSHYVKFAYSLFISSCFVMNSTTDTSCRHFCLYVK